MEITRIETIRVNEHPRNIWVQVHTDSGIVGLGETFYAPSVVQAAIHDYFGPLLIGRDPFEIERHWEAMFRLSDHAGYGGAEMRAILAKGQAQTSGLDIARAVELLEANGSLAFGIQRIREERAGLDRIAASLGSEGLRRLLTGMTDIFLAPLMRRVDAGGVS